MQSSHAMKKERSNEDEGDIQVTIPYKVYRKLHRLSKMVYKTPEEVIEEALRDFLRCRDE